MIPKIIHYCWFGGKDLPELETRCMSTWPKHLEGYEIIRWDESNFPIDEFPFAKGAYEARKFAFVADVARLYALSRMGGIYLDTDIEILKSFDDLLNTPLFMGFETAGVVQTGVIGAEPDNDIIKAMLAYYIDKGGFTPGVDDKTANSELFARYFKEKGIPLDDKNYHSDTLDLYCSEYLCPIDQATWEVTATDRSYCIHYLSGSWLPRKDVATRKMKSIFGRIFGFRSVALLRKLLGR